MAYLLVILGFVLLLIGGDFLVRAAVSIAFRFKISTLVVGLTVVSFATSAPELLVSLEAALRGHPEIALGNVIGSNIANVALILGITALIFKMSVPELGFRKDWAFLMLCSFLFLGAMATGVISFLAGFIFILLLVYYNVKKVRDSRKELKQLEKLSKDKELEIAAEQLPVWSTMFFLISGILALRYGARFLIDGAVPIATDFGISERVISLTLISIGTSVPELAASLVAAFKRENDISLGNILGSNIFNILAVIGITATITPIPVIDFKMLYFDGMWMLGFSAILFPLSIFFTRGVITRWEGAILLALYGVYLFSLFG
jgi:cation:H+ antiporter